MRVLPCGLQGKWRYVLRELVLRIAVCPELPRGAGLHVVEEFAELVGVGVDEPLVQLPMQWVILDQLGRASGNYSAQIS